MTAQERAGAAHNVGFTQATATEGGSRFTVRGAKVDTIEDCRKLYRHLMLDPTNMAANHNTAVYRLYSPIGARTSDGYNDDGEFGMGRTVRDYLQQLDARNVIIFVTRIYGGVHIGPKRFTIVKDLVKQVIETMKKE